MKLIFKQLSGFFSVLFLFLFYNIDTYAQSADLIIQKSGPNQVYVGQYMTYTFTITNNGPTSVSNATWNDNLPAGMTNVTFIGCTSSGGAVCPSGGNISISNTNFSGTIPSLPNGGQIIMTIGMNAPAPANGTSFSNTATVAVPPGTTEVDPTTNSATFNTTLLTKTDISTTKTVNKATMNCGALPDTIEYEVKWVNGGPSAANGVSLQEFFDVYATPSGSGNAIYNFPISIFGETWYSSPGSSTMTDTLPHSPSILTGGGLSYISTTGFIVPVWEAGDTIRLRFKLRISPPTITGCGRNLSLDFRNQSYFNIPGNITLIDTNQTNNYSTRVSTILNISAVDISISKNVNPLVLFNGDTLTMTVTLQNAPGGSTASPVIWRDTLPATFDYLPTSFNCISTGGATCAAPPTYNPTTRVLEQIVTSMPTNSQLLLEYKGVINTLYDLTVYTRSRAYPPCVDCIPATNFTETNYQINGPCDTVYAGLDGDTTVCDNHSGAINLFDIILDEELYGTWSQIFGSGGVFDMGAGTFSVTTGATNSLFMYVKTGVSPCPNDTSYALVNINPTYSISLSETICANGSYSVCGSSYNTSGTHVTTCQTVNGCDSIVTLNLTVNPTYNETVTASICEGATYNVCSSSYNTTGTHVTTCTSVNGCDSIVTLYLTVNPSYYEFYAAIICEGQSVNICGNLHSTTGTYTDTCTSINGCDSIVILSLVVDPKDTLYYGTSGTTCFVDSITIDGITYYETGTATITSYPEPCSVSIEFINIQKQTFDTIYNTICQGDSVVVISITSFSPTYDTSIYYNAGIYNDTSITGFEGQCPYISTLILTVNPTYNETVTASICQGSSYSVCGSSYNTSGTHITTCQSINGCDSIVTLILTILPNVSVSNIQTTCAPDGQTYVVSFNINGTAPYSVTGGGGSISGNTFTSDAINTGTGYNFNVSDANNCNIVNVNGNSPNCADPCGDPKCGNVKVIKN